MRTCWVGPTHSIAAIVIVSSHWVLLVTSGGRIQLVVFGFFFWRRVKLEFVASQLGYEKRRGADSFQWGAWFEIPS